MEEVRKLKSSSETDPAIQEIQIFGREPIMAVVTASTMLDFLVTKLERNFCLSDWGKLNIFVTSDQLGEGYFRGDYFRNFVTVQ